MSYNNTIRVFEHQRIIVDQEIDGITFTKTHFEALRSLTEDKHFDFYTIGHESVRFQQFVGVIQAGNLCIEVLPKLDQWLPNKQLVQSCLIEMLRRCRFLKVSTVNQSSLSLRPLPLMDLFWEFFLEEVALILKEGLLRSYIQEQSEKRFLKGRLLLSKQLEVQGHNKACFHTSSTAYSYDHPFNIVLYQALLILKKLPLSPRIYQLLSQVLHRFPDLAHKKWSRTIFERTQFTWKNARYRHALVLARMILQNRTPDIRAGENQAMALMFDMNRLYEAFIYQELLRSAPPGARISYQEQRLFWLKRSLRPDIVIRYKEQTIVVDTKWKVLKKGQPAMGDLRQMYVYNKYFQATKGVLLYPKLLLNQSIKAPFHGVGEYIDHGICFVAFIDLIKDGQLDRGIGEHLWQLLI